MKVPAESGFLHDLRLIWTLSFDYMDQGTYERAWRNGRKGKADWRDWADEWLSALWCAIAHTFGRTVCAVRGHRIEVDGHFGPDSGYESWDCDRCHCVGGSHTYY